MLKPAPDALPPQHGIKRYFLVQKYTFAATGIDPTSFERTVFNRFLAWIPITALFTLWISFLLHASHYILDMKLVTDILSPVWQSMITFIKLSYFLYNKKKFIQLVRKIWMCNLEARNEELKIVAEENNKDKIFATCFSICVISTACMALISQFVFAWLNYRKGFGYFDSLETPFKAAYFIDPKTYFGYIFAYIWNAVAVYFVTFCTLSTDSLFSWFMHNVSAQFRILKLRLKSTAEFVRRPGDEKEFQKLLIMSIKYHRRVIDMAQTLNDVYMVTVLIMFTISFMQIACLAFQFSRSGKIFHLFYLISSSCQLFLYCHGGQRIQNESTAVADAIYNYFNWHDFSVESKKLLLLPMMRAQKPCIFTGVFFVADLSLFVWVLKTSISYITILVTLEEKKIY